MRLAACSLALVLCVGCQATPKVTPAPEIPAIIKQNRQTKQHIGKTKVSQGDAGKHLDSAVKALNQLLDE
jgi:hypothetical protein